MKTRISYNWNLGHTDNAGRWYPSDEIAQQYVDENGYREPSRNFPLSLLRACSTKKFNKYYEEKKGGVL